MAPRDLDPRLCVSPRFWLATLNCAAMCQSPHGTVIFHATTKDILLLGGGVMLSKISEKLRFEPVAFSAVTILAMLSAGTATQDHDNNRSGQRTLSERVQTV